MGLVGVRQKAGIYLEELLEWIDGQRWKDKWFFCSPFVVFFDVILVWHLKEKHGDCLSFRWFRPEVRIWNILFTMFWPNRKKLISNLWFYRDFRAVCVSCGDDFIIGKHLSFLKCAAKRCRKWQRPRKRLFFHYWTTLCGFDEHNFPFNCNFQPILTPICNSLTDPNTDFPPPPHFNLI